MSYYTSYRETTFEKTQITVFKLDRVGFSATGINICVKLKKRDIIRKFLFTLLNQCDNM